MIGRSAQERADHHPQALRGATEAADACLIVSFLRAMCQNI